jgi:succinate dehydrogenase / fumarate reductase cytochrome b subunit
VKDKRPKNLNLLTIRQPIPAIVSILHRISGIILFICIPVMLWALNLSLTTYDGFVTLQEFFRTPWTKFIIWCLLAPFIYHFVAGIRHLLMDVHVGEELKSGRISAYITIAVSIVLIILTGIWLW